MNYYQMIQKGLKYKYYEGINLRKDIDLNTDARRYIEEYFQQGQKFNVLYNRNQELLLNSMRRSHMISLYGLGAFVLSKSNLSNLISRTYLDIIPSTLINDYNNSPYYYWFLTALYHDIGYNHAININFDYDLFNYKNSCRAVIDNCQNPLSKKIFQKYFDNRFDYSYMIRKSISEPYYRYLNIYEYSPYILNSYYHPGVYKKYYSSRNLELKTNPQGEEIIEHGIYGGKLFFNNIIRAMIECTNNYQTYNDEYWRNGSLVWFPEQLDIFKDIGMVIATHNMWKSAFLRYEIKSSFRRISKNNPLSYLLCICDNIDLYKHLFWEGINQPRNTSEIIEIMEKVDVSFDGKSFKMSSDQFEFEQTFKKIYDNIIAYIDVDVDIDNREGIHSIKITF